MATWWVLSKKLKDLPCHEAEKKTDRKKKLSVYVFAS
jgi:hypothetical protein